MTNKILYNKKEKGRTIDNLPDESCGVQTGQFMIDFYGCWYEIKPNNGAKNFWMIGEYPQEAMTCSI